MRSKYIVIVLSVVAALAVAAVVARAGDPDNPPGPPGTTNSYTLDSIYDRLISGAAGMQSAFIEPTSGPQTGTMHTLNEIMAVAPQVNDASGATAAQVAAGATFWSLRSGAWGLRIGTMPDNGAVTIVPTTAQQTIPTGYHNGSGYVEGDADLQSGNIRSGVSIFGVAGNPFVVNTASGDAVAGDILSGKVAWVDGGELTGTMADNGAVTIVPTTTLQTIPAGYHNGSGYVEGDADLQSGNIRSGVSIFGVAGSPDVVNTASGDAVAGDILSGKVAWVDGAELTGTMPDNGAVTIVPTTTLQTIPAGYHNGSGYVEGDADLVAGNIKGGVSIFGVDGTLYASVPKTGQTTSYATGDDGDLERGTAWPVPRFNTGTTGTVGVTVVVTDTLTGLVWLEDGNCIANYYPGFDNDATPGDGRVTWQHALDFVAGITSGSYPNCAAGFSDWRLPNARELQSVIDYGRYPALPSGHPFNVVADGYWSSTSYANNPTVRAWHVTLSAGEVDHVNKANTYYVWPVRSGQ